MGISQTTYYRTATREEKILKSDLKLQGDIIKIQLELPGYGYRRIKEHLLREGQRVNGKRLRRVMKRFSLFSCRRRTDRPKSARVGKKLCYPNLIGGLKLNAPNQVWATDITFIKLLREFIFLSAIIDVYTRKIVGWSLSKIMDANLTLEAIKVAVEREKPQPGIIHHSDRGTQYCSIEYVEYLEKNNFRISMSKVGTPTDNAFIESFFRTLKYEEVYFKKYQTKEDVINNLPKFIQEVYNTKRLHSSLGYKTPKEFEAEVLKVIPAMRPIQKIWGYAANN